MASKPPSDLLYDSEATLRQVDSALDLLCDAGPAGPALRDASQRAVDQGHVAGASQSTLHHGFAPIPPAPMGLIGLSQALARGYAEIVSVLGSLREGRHLLESNTVDRLQHTHAKLREVTTATETAAVSILDGLERCLRMVDQLEAASPNDPTSTDRHLPLRNELFTLVGHMQFHDITTQQINYASSVITEMESKLAELASVLDANCTGLESVGEAPHPSVDTSFDPGASTLNVELRQSVADDIFGNGLNRL